MEFVRILFLLKLVILSALTVNGSASSNSGSVLCVGNGQNNQSNPKLCEAVLGRPLDLRSMLCFYPIYWYVYSIEQQNWVVLNNTDKDTLHLNATSIPPEVIMYYKCSCSGQKQIYFRVEAKQGDMNTEGTPQWFLKPHEMQSYGEISVDANGTGTAYCGAYRDEVNTTVEYRLCVTKPLVKQLDLTACYLEPTAMYSDLVCYPCQPLAPGAGVNLEPFDLTNHVGMVTAGCKVTSNTINQTYACMAYRKNQSTEITSDYQLLGYFSFVPAVTPNTFSSPTIINTHRDLIIGLAVAVAGFLAIFICCCLCFCCCCCYKRKVGKLQVRLGDPPADQPNPPAEAVVQQQGHQQPVQPPVQPPPQQDVERREVPEGVAVAQGIGDERDVDEKIPLLHDSAETGYHSTDQRPVATWPRGGNPKKMTATLTDSLTQHKVGEVNLQPTDPRSPGNKAMFYLPCNRKYDFNISATNKTITLFTGQPMFAMSPGTKVGNTGQNLPIPDDINDMLPVNMTELIQFVPQMAHKWCEIGMYLELNNCVRELKDSHNNPRLKMITILDTWIESGRDVSWHRLVEVLEQPGVELGAVAVEIKLHLYEKFPQVPDNIDFLDPLSVDCLMQLAPRFAPHWERVGRLLKFKDKVAELKRDSKLSDLVKMTIIFDAWSKEEGRVSWLNLLEALEEDKELSWMKAHIAQHLQNRLMRRERRQLQYQ